ncbi:MAG: SEC-C domain-containing protein [Alistipes sp.]|nr:SEC-C domain-containing protein [Alistipes sp.]
MNNVIEGYTRCVQLINAEYQTLVNLSNDELRSELSCIEHHIRYSDDKNKAINEYLVKVYAIVKETARRFSEGNIVVTANPYDRLLATSYDFVEIQCDKAIYKNRWDVGGVPFVWNMVHYDEQLLGGILLHYGYAIEMATGEGKTLVATLPVFLNALTHNGVHLMTVNDYLSKRDFETTCPIYMFHGLSADCIEYYSRNDERMKRAYKADISFGTTSTFTFDYLWDHIAIRPEECVQQSHNFAIIDELDSILIDNADHPHIIGGANYYDIGRVYQENFPIVKELIEQGEGVLYSRDKLSCSAKFTDKGKAWLADKTEIPDLYNVERLYEIEDFDKMSTDAQNSVREKLDLQNVLLRLLLALVIFERDVDYIVSDDSVKILDQNTGRVKESSRWRHGLHTAIEIKENLKAKNDFDAMAVISLSNYFRLYDKIAGMSGTIMPVEDELLELYGLRCTSIPTHKLVIRKDEPLRIFKTSKDRDYAILDSIIENHSKGRPVLVGSKSVKRSEEICCLLDEYGLKYNKLNAKTIKDEAMLVAKAGEGDTITASTSVAGRGTDIKPSQQAIDNGGLMIIGTELFESVRVDRQLKGRSGRQGNPGSSVFFASLEDDILLNLDVEDLESLKECASRYSDSEISYDDIRCYFDKAQSNRELYFKTHRKATAYKDNIIAPQRRKFYQQRNSVLFNSDVAEHIIDEIVKEKHIDKRSIDPNLRELYSKTNELILRSRITNPNRKIICVPFSDNMCPFAIFFDVELAKMGYTYFCKEFKRQIILQVYDQEWKKLILYMMGDLDAREIEMLDDRYLKMIDEIHTIILNRLQNATMPFEVRDNHHICEDGSIDKDEKLPRERMHRTEKMRVESNAMCPCGSGKQFCECHGNSIRRSNERVRRR